jgi:hypothetical protein
MNYQLDFPKIIHNVTMDSYAPDLWPLNHLVAFEADYFY